MNPSDTEYSEWSQYARDKYNECCAMLADGRPLSPAGERLCRVHARKAAAEELSFNASLLHNVQYKLRRQLFGYSCERSKKSVRMELKSESSGPQRRSLSE